MSLPCVIKIVVLTYTINIVINLLELGSRNRNSVKATDYTIYTTVSLLLRSTVLCDLTVILSHTLHNTYRLFAQFWSEYERMKPYGLNAKTAFNYFLSRIIKICDRWWNIGLVLHTLYKHVVTVV